MGLRDSAGMGGIGIGSACLADSVIPNNMDLVPGIDGGTSLGLGVTFIGMGAGSLAIGNFGSRNLGFSLIIIGIGLILVNLSHEIMKF